MSFLALPANKIISVRGDYTIGSFSPAHQVMVEIGGELGGATVTLGRLTLSGEFKAYPLESGDPMEMEADDMVIVSVTSRGFIILRVENAGSTTAIEVAVNRVTTV